MIFRRVVWFGGLLHVGMGLLTLFAIWLFGYADQADFEAWVWQAAAIQGGALLVQSMIHMRWLQAEAVLQTPGRVESDAVVYAALRDLLYFPFRSVFLAMGLWVGLAIPLALMYARLADAGPGPTTVVAVLIISAGLAASLFQNHLFRQIVYPPLERFLERLPDSGQAWARSRTAPFSVRAKLLLHCLLALTIVLSALMAVGYGLEYQTVRERTVGHQRMLLLQLGAVFDRSRAARDPAYAEETLAVFGQVLGGGVAVLDRESGRSYHWTRSAATDLLPWLDYRLQGTNRRSPELVGVAVQQGRLRLAAVAPWDDLAGPLGAFLATFGLAVLAAWALILGIVTMASRELSRSVRRIEFWAERLAEGGLDMSPRVPEDDDIADLAMRLDALRIRLQAMLSDMERATSGTRNLSGQVQEHAVLLRQTTEEDVKLVALTHSLLGRLEASLRDHQRAAGVLSQAAEDTVVRTGEMGILLREVDGSSGRMRDTVDLYRDALDQLDTLLRSTREHLRIFSAGIDEARRGLGRLDDTLDALVDTVSRARQVGTRVGDQNVTTAETLHRSFLEIAQLSEAMAQSAEMMAHLRATMRDLQLVAADIHDVAEDTKLLSLNAAIRSVKADDDGRSFAVISRTIQGLAVATQDAVGHLMEEVGALGERSGDLGVYVDGLVTSLQSAVQEADQAGQGWRRARSSLHDLRGMVERFDGFIHELRSLRDAIHQRQSEVDRHVREVSRVLGDLLVGLDQRRQQVVDLDQRATQLRNFSAYQVNKGRIVGDHIEQVRAMSGHVLGFAQEHLRQLRELDQQLDHLRVGMTENAGEAREISASLRALEAAIRRFQDAFVRFRLEEQSS